MGIGLIARGLAASLVVVAACGGDGDSTATPDTQASSASATSAPATDEGDEWCDELAVLLESEGDATSAEIAGAPDEIAAALTVLVEDTEVDLERSMEAYALVQAYGHDRCGRDHPFCSLWITLSGAIAASAFRDDDPKEVSAELEEVVAGMRDVLLDHVPQDQRAHLQTTLASLDDPALSDADERAAEAAEDALDEWAWSEGCEGASEPLADE